MAPTQPQFAPRAISWSGQCVWQQLAKLTGARQRPSLLSPEEIDALLEKGARDARELSELIAPVFRLGARQRNLVLR